MKCRVLHESRGRLRVHLLCGRMTLHQADVLEYYLRSQSGVDVVKVYDRTQDAVVTYRGARDAVVRALATFTFAAAEAQNLVPEHTTRALNRDFEDKLVLTLARRALAKLFLPAPVAAALAITRSVRYIGEGLKSLWHRKLSVAVLDATAVTVSLVRGDFDTASSVMFMLRLGEILEEWTHKKSVADLAGAMALNVDQVWLCTGEGEVLAPISSIRAGDEIVVRTGGMIPLDGTVASGEATVNQSSITGESMPVPKRPGSYVYAGTVAEEGECVVRVDKVSGDGRYDRVVRMIEESERLKSTAEDKAARLADRLVPYTLGGTALTYLLTRNVTKTLAVLMVDFSCALKLSVPIAVLSAMRESSSYHISVKGGRFLEAVSRANTVVFDKTGTLTLGLTDGEEHRRSGAAAAVAELKSRGMELWMISGDKRDKADRIAKLLGIDNVLCEVKPSDKSDAVKKLQAKGKRVCFVGDGINDSPALACADIGVALGCGTDIAISAADVMIVGSGIDSVKTVFDISAATMRNVRQNLIWAVVYNVVCIPLAAAGIINPSIAAAAMALSANGVLLNALRLKNYGK